MSGPKAPMHPRPESHDSGQEEQMLFISSNGSMSHPVMVSTADDSTFSLSAGDSDSTEAHPVQRSSASPSSLFLSSFLSELR
ncbi:MAG: hypothetical protein J6Z16_04310 [Candidatus Methanomethylophilaceae archaeon]|nr:hypothetical protein [Candidatus Methanomethylophilaceae archaeon]